MVPVRSVFSWLRARRRVVVVAALLALLAGGFLQLGSEVTELDTEGFDHAILLAMRTDAGDPIGPAWLTVAMINLSALGSGAVATVVVTLAAVFLLVARRPTHAALVVVCGLGSWAVMAAVKTLHARPRPTVVTPLDDLGSFAFPSGHTLSATAVYLTLAAVVALGLTERRLQACVLIMAGLLAVLVGVTRVYMGVHYPTDVLGGWLVGGAWALLCAVAASALQQRAARA